MSKRFTDSSKFRDPWYRRLSPKMKCLWEYILAECDLAGILEFDIDAIEFHIGDMITMDDLKSLGDRIYFLEENKIFIPKFVSFQQGSLNIDNKAHKSIFIAFEKYGIPIDLNMDNFTSPFNPPWKGDKSPTGISNSKGIGNSIVKDVKDYEKLDIQRAVDLYNELASEYCLPRCQKLTVQRKAKLNSRLRDCGGIDGWFTVLNEIRKSDFLLGKKTDWKADFDFLLQEKSFTKLIEGGYRNNENKKGKEDAMFNAWSKA